MHPPSLAVRACVKFLAGTFVVAVGLAASRTARAQACPAGQTVTVDTAGRCCYPNQVWSSLRGVCAGVPICPGGMEASGEDCLGAAPTCPAGMNLDSQSGRCVAELACTGGGCANVSAHISVLPQVPVAPAAPPVPVVDAPVPTESTPPSVPLVPSCGQAAPAAISIPMSTDAATSRLSVMAGDNGAYSVEVRTESGGVASCSTPCFVDVPRGLTTVTVHGAQNLTRQIFVGASPVIVRVPVAGRTIGSGPPFLGITFLGLGAAGLVAGMVVMLSASSDCGSDPNIATRLSCQDSANSQNTMGEIFLGVGASAAVTGLIPLLMHHPATASSSQLEVVGGSVVASGERHASPMSFRLAAAPMPGGASAGVVVTF